MKNKTFKKVLSIVLSVVMTLSVFSYVPLNVQAAPDKAAVTKTQTEEPATEPEVQAPVTEEPVVEQVTEPVVTTQVVEKTVTDPVVNTVVFDVEQAYNYLMSLATQEEIDAYIATLDVNQYKALEAYMLANTTAPVIESKVFTDAGPFMPPVNVSTFKMFNLRAANGSDNGLELSKTVTGPVNGVYTLRLESYATGSKVTTTVTESVPADIVLVLDQSGSMAYNFDGNSTNTNTARRQYAMKQAVNNFINAVQEKYSETCDNRMAIVKFGSNASTLQGWTLVNATGATTLKNRINGLPDSPSGATNVAAGMTQAETLMGSDYSYSGANTKRSKVVIVFTDGVPTTSSDFDTTVATNSIASAKNLKDAGVTVYSVGIFNGVNESQLYGDSGFDRNSNGTVGSDWSDFSFWNIGDIKSYDVPAGNRFLNYLSSNFSNTTEIGIKNYSRQFLGIGYTGWEITKNFDRTDTGYYLTATDSESLNDIFQTISNNIETGGSSVTLDSEAVVKDVISDQFTLPEGANTSSIKVYTADCTNADTFAAPVEFADADVSISADGKTISVTNFDFAENWVGTVTTNGVVSYGGKKLIIEIPVVMREGFLGGNGVLTNAAGSGVYEDDEAETPVEEYDSPEVDVEIGNVEVTAADKNVYLLGSVTKEDIKEDVVVSVGDITLDMDAENYGLEEWQTEYVDIGDPSDLTDITADTGYTVSVTVAPVKTTGSAQAKSDSDTAKVYVYKPTVDFKDLKAYLTADMPTLSDALEEGVVWKRGNTEAVPENMTGTEPTLVHTYTPSVEEITTAEDITVDVTTKIGTTDVTEHVTYAHTDCVEKEECEEEFVVHVFAPTVTFKDLGVYLGDDVPTNAQLDKAVVNEVWTNATLGEADASMGTAPTLVHTYSGVSGTVITSVEDVEVSVTTKVGDTEVATGKFELHVLAPEITYKDSQIEINSAADYETENFVSAEWKLADADVAELEMVKDEAPTLLYNYNPAEAAFTQDTPVAVTVKVSFTDITDKVEFVHEDCDFTNCAWETYKDTHQFIVHIKCADLTITKEGCDTTLDPDQTFIFTVTGPNNYSATVVIAGNDSVTIKNLPIGTYTVTELENWSWRYTAVDDSKDCNLATVDGRSVTFENTRTNPYWLDGNDYNENTFAAK